MFICQTALYLIIHLEFYILLPLSYHFCLTNNTNILDQCRKTRFVHADAWTEERSQPQLNMCSVSLVDLTRWLPASLQGSGLLDRHVSSNMKEHESRPSFVSWLRAEGPRLQHDTPSHSRVSGLHSSGAPPESGHFSSREPVHVSSCKLGLSVQRPGRRSADRPCHPCQVHFMDFTGDHFTVFCRVRSMTRGGRYLTSLSHLFLTVCLVAAYRTTL